MKKYFAFAAMALVAAMNFSCSENDNGKFTITDESGNQYPVGVVATFEGKVGTQATLAIGVYDRFDIYGVDFGDGNIITDTVCFENGGLRGEDGGEQPGTTHTRTTEFKGTVSGKGIVRVFGKSDMWTLGITGLMPTTFYEPSMVGLHELKISSVDIESLSLPAFESLTLLSISNCPVKSVNVSNQAALTSLSIIHTSTSAYNESPLASIDVSQNKELTSITLGSSFYKPGILTSVDLSNNTKLETIVVSNNKLKSITLPEGAEINQLSLDKNELTAIDLSKIKSLKSIQVNDNKLSSLDLSKMVEASRVNFYASNNELTELEIPVAVYNCEAQNNKLTKFSVKDASYSCKLENNALTIATLPVKPASLNTNAKKKRFTYNPQADMEVTPAGAVVDLSAQAKAQGELTEEVATTYTVKAGDATLVADTDYKIEDGKITFLKSQKGVVVEMTTTAFPKLTALKTKAFDVTVAE